MRREASGEGWSARRALASRARAPSDTGLHYPVVMARTRNPVARVHKIIDAWPETKETISHGAPTFWGGKRTFASLWDNHHGDGIQALWIKSTKDAQDDLVAADPETFFVPPYMGPSGWIGVRIDRGPDWDMIASLLEEAYRMVAPKRALKQLDAE